MSVKKKYGNYFWWSKLAIKVDVLVKPNFLGRVHLDLMTGRAAYFFEGEKTRGWITGIIKKLGDKAVFVADSNHAKFDDWCEFERVNNSQDSIRNIEALWSIFELKVKEYKKALSA